IAEKNSNIELDWYKEYWVNGTRTIDYAFDSLWEEGGKSLIRVKRVGLMPMPIDLQLTFRDGSSEMHYIPLDLMYGAKPAEDTIKRKVYPAWKWTSETYVIETDRRIGDIVLAEIDPSQRMADTERQNNKLKLQ
ncbi:MAG: M1 family peptidase, partial [Chitinophagaceae bacterium]|nr:M1 family peptidase [Chitinophagaceae bacterium]